ncbi:AMMECR1 domain-containing protein [Halenospora varia]|nr:AMMECR1 domain-containing protein [Halenospora varia]
MATVEHCLYCFEVLSANLEKRGPLSLYQVQASWDDYPKGLEDDAASIPSLDDKENESTSSETHTAARPALAVPRNPAVQRLSSRDSSSSSGISTPASASSTSLSPSTANTTPSSSTPSFVPVGQHPRHTSQRASNTSEFPVFVTWNTISTSSASSHDKTLRGCIGTFVAKPLVEGLKSFTLHSALQDPRFPPISIRELPTLEVSVTLLTDFETCKDAMDWELGIHGIRIYFYARNRSFEACYLPDVAVEQGWDKEETIISLMRKAGWGGKREKWREVGDMKVVRFQGKAESVGYEEFRGWKEWVAKGTEGK